MSKKTKLRLISLCMFIAAVIFVLCAISNPQLGRVVYIGPFRFGGDQWRACYKAYVLVMLSLLIASFFVKNKKTDE